MLFIPYSALEGANVSTKSDKLSWYTGPTLLAALDTLTVPDKPLDKPLRLPIQDAYSISGFGTVPVGRVETGVMKVGDSIIIMPAGVKTEVKSIEMHHQQLQKAEPGDNVGFNIKGVDRKDVKKGDVVGPSNNPPMVAAEFTAQIVVINHPNGNSPRIHPGVPHTHRTGGVHDNRDNGEEGPEDRTDAAEESRVHKERGCCGDKGKTPQANVH